MTKQFKIEHNLETGEITEIELTDQEINELAELRAAVELGKSEAEAKATQKAALLSKLGINEEEAKLLLG